MEADRNELGVSANDWMREYAWQYFLAHGQARLTTFRFYLVFCAILCTGLFGILASGERPIMAAPLSFVLSFLSFVYWQVDRRHKQLIANAQAALRAVEAQWQLPPTDGGPNALCLFTLDASRKAQIKSRSALWSGTLTYSLCVSLVFAVFGIGGVLGGAGVVLWQMM